MRKCYVVLGYRPETKTKYISGIFTSMKKANVRLAYMQKYGTGDFEYYIETEVLI